MKKTSPIKPISCAIITVLLANCAQNPSNTSPDITDLTEKALVYSRAPTVSVVEIADEPFVVSEPLPSVPWQKYGNLSLNVQEQNFYDLIYEICGEKGIGLAVNSDVDVNRAITIALSYVSPVEAIKQIAAAAGYVAVYSAGTKQITISERALFSFKLPKSVFATLSGTGQLIDTETIAINQGASNVEDDIENKLSQLVGPNAKVNVFAASGIVTVSDDVRGLSKIHAFLNDYLAIASATLNIRAAIIAVSLTEEDDRGVHWKAALGSEAIKQTSGASISFGDKRTAEGNATGNLTITTKGLLTVLNSLSVQRDIEILAQPQITTSNLQTFALYSGSKIPFLGSVKTTTEESENGRTETEVTREIETTDEGILLQVTADILDKTQVQVHVQPHITTIRGVKTFGGVENQSSAPIEESAETNAIVTLTSGTTLILGGIRTSSTSLETSSILPRSIWDTALAPLLATKDDVISQKEYWVLLNVEIAEGPILDALINEVAETSQ